MKTIKIFDSINELNFFAAEQFVVLASQSINERGRFTVALAGGSTPKSLYQLLASGKYKDQIEWRKIFFFFGDERNVFPEDAESNFRMANENLLVPLNIAGENIFRWQTELKNAPQIADEYAESLLNFFQDKLPRFDLILLGMGGDGHTASLFPFTEALKETEKIAVANSVEKLDAVRLTLTYPLINNARNVMFLVKGADKAEVVREVLQRKFQPEKLPSQAVKSETGELYWLIDTEAAALLDR